MSIERQAIAGLKSTALVRLFGQLASWLSTLVVIRLLAPDDYGLMAIVGAQIGIGTAVADFGLATAMIHARELSRTTIERLAGVVWLLHLAVSAAYLAAVPLVGAWYGDARLAPLLQVSTLLFFFAAAGAVPHAMAARSMNFAWLARVELVAMLVGSLATLGLALLGIGAWALVDGMLAAAAIRAWMLVHRGQNVRPSLRFGGLGPHLRYSAQMALSQVLSALANQSDVLIGGRLLSREALGAYSVAFHLATLPMHKIMGVVNQIAFAAVARLQDEGERLRTAILLGMRLMAAAAVGLTWGASAVAPELVRIVAGPQWQAAIVPLQLVALIVPLRMVTMLLSTAVGGVGSADVNLRSTLTALVVWPPCFAVGAQWGATGLAAAWLVASPLTFMLNAHRMCGALQIRIAQLAKTAQSAVTAGILMYASVSAGRLAMEALNDGARLLMLTGLGAAVYAASLVCGDRRLWPDMRRLMATARG